MKKLLVIVCCCCIFVPEMARIIGGSYCAYTIINEDADPVCVCTFNNIPADFQQTSMPDAHKQLLQQTDWQYLSQEGFIIGLSASSIISIIYPSHHVSLYNAYSKRILQPPQHMLHSVPFTCLF